MKLKLRLVGTSTGVVLPKEFLNRLKVGKGDHVFAVETLGYLLTPYDPAVDEQIKIGRKLMRKYRDTLHALD